ncbi:FAD-binding oxidoreductase [Saccharothrix syringae]|uniref:FAD-binding oxidoreductase n=1 Tax=Saccharothrix syringae TaxID=103733 RepID=A0A5Q0H2R6_SACSY|nr:FAD-binding oxidoreductase [Saccharothrix syringae]QFZ20215.1 FAD-binding oxidoreductase [Saccharothrix syringae]
MTDHDTPPPDLAARAVTPGHPDYDRLRSTYAWPGSPALLLRPTDPDQVARALTHARTRPLPLAIRSGGHGISGRATNDGGIVIDLTALHGVEVLDHRLVRVGAGARWGDVARTLAPHGLAISSGDYGDVGVGGLATSGGQGLLARAHGLTVDRVRAATVVLADGRTVRADADHHPDLFWALRGAGGNLGVVTSFDIEAVELSDVVHAAFTHDATDTAAFLRAWGDLVEHAPRELTAFLTLVRAQDHRIAQTRAVWAGDDTGAAAAALQPFLDLAPVHRHHADLLPYAAIMAPDHARHRGQGRGRSRSALVEHLDPRTTDVVADLFTAGHTAHLEVRAVGGAVNDVPADVPAYAHRDRNFSLAAVLDTGPAAWDRLDADAIHLSFETHDQAAALTKVFPPDTLARLRRVKAAYDPDNVFRHNFPVTP